MRNEEGEEELTRDITLKGVRLLMNRSGTQSGAEGRRAREGRNC